MIAPTRSASSVSEPTLYVAFELSQATWKLALTSGMAATPLLQTVAPGDAAALLRVVAAARRRLRLPSVTRVVSCYEAGRDGFWIHRWLTTLTVQNRVVDSASIEVSRRAKRAKTDRLDALKLVAMLIRVCHGERGVWREVTVPSAEAEATRHGSRERARLVQDRAAAGWGGAAPRGPATRTARGGRRCGTGRTSPCRRRCRGGSRGRRRGWRCWTRRSPSWTRRRWPALRPRRRRVRRSGWSRSEGWRRRAPRRCSMKGWCGGRFAIAVRSGPCSGFRRRRSRVERRCGSKGSVGRAIRAYSPR